MFYDEIKQAQARVEADKSREDVIMVASIIACAAILASALWWL